jgi:hypothetical protein
VSEEDDYVSEEDDYVSFEDDYMSDKDDLLIEEDEYDEKKEIILRGLFHTHGLDDYIEYSNYYLTHKLHAGPGFPGFDQPFDNYCIFGNFVELNFHQRMTLRNVTEVLPRPTTKEYVCTLDESNVTPSGECFLVSSCYLSSIRHYSEI